MSLDEVGFFIELCSLSLMLRRSRSAVVNVKAVVEAPALKYEPNSRTRANTVLGEQIIAMLNASTAKNVSL